MNELNYIKATLTAFGPCEGVRFTKDTWAKLHKAMSAVVAQPAPVQEPFAWCVDSENSADWAIAKTKEGVEVNAKLMDAECIKTVPFPLYTTPPTPQPVPVKTYHDGKPWPVAPKPWVGLSRDEVLDIEETTTHPLAFARAIEQRLKEKNT